MAWWIFSSHGRTNSSGVSIDYFASTAKKIVLCAGPIGRNYIKKTKRCRNYWNIRKHWFIYLENQKPKLNPFVSDALFLYLLKTSENLSGSRKGVHWERMSYKVLFYGKFISEVRLALQWNSSSFFY